MFLLQLKHELWKLFGKKRTYIGFGAFLFVQLAVILMFRYTKAASAIRRALEGGGYPAETFITAGEMEVKAWTYRKGWKAPQCAGVIHTDFEKGFIRAEVIKYEDYIKYGSEAAVKEAGKMGVEGKEYVVQDGDIMHFRFNV